METRGKQVKAQILYKNKFKNPDYLYVSDKLGDQPYKISVAKFTKQLGITWCEANYIQAKHISQLKKAPGDAQMPEIAMQKLTKQISENREKLAIIHMGENLGYGVFARENIPTGIWVASYCGLLTPVNDKLPDYAHSSPYAIGISGEDSMIASINSEQYRNIGAFFQHLPGEKDNYKFFTDESVQVATENLEGIQFYYKNYPMMAFKTTRQILKGEILGWDYGITYWLSHQVVPCLFTTKGNIISPESYRSEKITLRITKDDYHIDVETSISELLKEFGPDKNIKFKTSHHEIMTITLEDFMLEYDKNRHVPYVIIKPSFLISLNQVKRETQKENEDVYQSTESQKASFDEDKAPASSSIPTPTPTPISTDNTRVGSQFRLQGQTKAHAICEELNRISVSLNLPKWNYSDKKNIAYINALDNETLKLLNNYLGSKQIKTQYGIHPTTKMPSLYVLQPNVKDLKVITALELQVEKVLQLN